MAASGTTKKISVNNILGASGTATLASATITGDLTVDTSVLKVDSLNNRVGIGTASPGYDLEVAGSVRSTVSIRGNFAGGTDIGHLRFVNSNGSIVGDIELSNTNGGASDSSYLAFKTANAGTVAEKLRLDSSGNLGLSVTPSAWGGSYKALQLLSVARSIAATGAGVGDLTVAFNAIYDSTDSRWEYAGTGDKAGRYSQTGSGNHRWFVSNTAGTAGNEITDFASAAMTLDASGNLGLGVTPSAGKGCLQLSSGITFPATQVASSDANTLDDYEEGTWTPVATGLTNVGAVTYNATYTKIGRVVYINLKVTAVTSTTSVANTTFFSGLPFTPALNSTITAVNEGNITSLGVGLIATGSTVFTPNWTAVQNATISGFYYV